jgi:hypothetical protein
MEIISKYKYLLFFLIAFTSLIIVFKMIFPVKPDNNHTSILKDTTIFSRYEQELKKDTVIKWYDKLIYQKSVPEKIYIQKTDTVFIETLKNMDLMLQVKKSNNKLIIRAVNQNGMTIKEYVYEDIYNDFIATSKRNDIFVKSKTFYWNGVNSIFNVQWSMFKDRKLNVNFGLETGVDYKNTVDFNAGAFYMPSTKDLLLNTNLKIKF